MTALDGIVATLARHLAPELATPDTRFLVGFSGGADSTVLLAALVRLVPPGRVTAVHVDHGIHQDSARWARHCRTVGESLGVRVDVCEATVPVGSNLEERARGARYAAFAARLVTGGTLLLAHHADDQAESVLLRLVTGRLLRGMPMRRPLGAGTLVRPLLDTPRARLADAAQALALPWVEDPANRDTSFDRGYLRHEILPRLRARWPDVALRVATQAERLAREAALGRAALDAELAAAGDILHVELLRRAPSARLLLRRFLERHGVANASEAALGEFERQWARDRAGAVVVEIAPDLVLRTFADAVHLVRRTTIGFAPCPWTLPGALEVGGWRLEACWTGTDPVPVATVEVRPRAGGERLRPSGRGGSRSVKRLLQEARVPTHLRTGYPLLYDGDRLVAVPGVAVDESAAARFATARSGARAECWRVDITRAVDLHKR